MNFPKPDKPPTSPIASAFAIGFALALGVWGVPAAAGLSSGQFNVNIELHVPGSGSGPGNPNSGFCRSEPSAATFGAIVTFVCRTGSIVDLGAPKSAVAWVPIHGGAYRFIHLESKGLPDRLVRIGVDGYTGIGTVTSWRVVTLAERDYLEMMIGW